MRRKIWIVSLCLLAAAMLSGCGKKTDAQKLVKLGDYKKLEVEVDKTYKITEASKKKTLEDYFLSAPIYTENKEKTTVESGEIVNIDYKGTKEGEEFQGGTAEDYNLEIGSGTFIAGFESGLIGKKVGEEVDLNLKFPEDYQTKELAGADVVFHVKINSIQDKTYPTYDTITDEYVAENYQIYYGISTVKELKKYVDDFLEGNLQSALGEALTGKLKEISKISDIPKNLKEERTKELKDYYKGLAKSQDQKFEDFLKNSYDMTEEDFNKQIEEQASDYIENGLIWEAVAAKEKIKAEGKDYDKFITDMMKNLSFDTEKDLHEVYPKVMVERMFLEQKAKEKLAEVVKIKYVEVAENTDEGNADASDSKSDEKDDAATEDKIDTTTGK
ncbi:MAG: hypothetical protein HFI37_02735 [Lachnospiraceae bacterium]|nr:hypothetical protein [Lachnospiraceae bacterium]